MLREPMRRFRRTQRIRLPIEVAFARFCDVRHLAEITPPFLELSWVTDPDIQIAPDTLIDYRVAMWGVPFPWQTRILSVEPPHHFAYEQAIGPLRSWVHTYTFEADGEHTRLIDEVSYQMGRGVAGRVAHRLFARRAIQAMFDHRATWIRALGGESAPSR